MGYARLLKIPFAVFLLTVILAVSNRIILFKVIDISNLAHAEVAAKNRNNYEESTLIAVANNETKKIQALMLEQFKALTQENLAGYMNTIAKDSPQYKATIELTRMVFERYDLKYELKNVQVVSVSNKEAKVKTTQVTTKIRGPAFRNNRLVAMHTLRKYNNQWKLYESKPLSIDYLD